MTSSISELKLGPLVSQNPPHLFYHLQHTHIVRFCELAQNHLWQTLHTAKNSSNCHASPCPNDVLAFFFLFLTSKHSHEEHLSSCRELATELYTDTSWHVLPTYQVSFPASPGNPLNWYTDGHGRVHTTENNQMDLTQKPATGNGSNLEHRHLATGKGVRELDLTDFFHGTA